MYPFQIKNLENNIDHIDLENEIVPELLDVEVEQSQ